MKRKAFASFGMVYAVVSLGLSCVAIPKIIFAGALLSGALAGQIFAALLLLGVINLTPLGIQTFSLVWL